MPRDPKDVSLTGAEQSARRAMEALDAAEYGSKQRGGIGGATGAEGKEGPPGTPSGPVYKWNTNTENTNPGSGKIKKNLLSTAIRISETDANGNGLAAWLATFDDSTNTVKGTLTIKSKTNPIKFAIYKVEGELTDNGEWDSIPVVAISIGTEFSSEEEVVVTFSPAGDKGPTGAEGKEGAAGTNGSPGLSGTGAPLAVRLATAAALPAYTRTTNKLEANANGALASIDGATAAVNDLILVKDGAAGADNGVYKVIKVGGAAEKWVMERYESMDTSAEVIPGQLITVAAGTKNHDEVYQLTTDATITLNTTALTFARTAPRDFGIVEALPTSEAIKGDTCTFKAATGVYWALRYTEEATYPWAKVGGPPLYAQYTAAESLVTESATPQTTNAPSITIPNIEMEADCRWGSHASLNSASGLQTRMKLFVGGSEISGAATNGWTAGGFTPASTVVPLRAQRRITITKGSAVQARYYREGSAGTATFYSPYLEVDPLRVG